MPLSGFVQQGFINENERIYRFVFFVTNVSANSYEVCIDQLEQFEKYYNSNLDEGFRGEIDSLVKKNEKVTTVIFDNNELFLPYLGVDSMVIKPTLSAGSYQRKNRYGEITIDYYETGYFKEEYFRSYNLPVELFEGDISYDWMIMQGFKYKKEDVDCDGDVIEALRVINYLFAKAGFMDGGASVYEFSPFGSGLIHINSEVNVVYMKILSGKMLITVTFFLNNDDYINEITNDD